MGEGLEIDICVARESNLVAVAAKTSPAVVNQRAAVNALVLHVVIIYMVAPECLAEAVETVVGKLLLPVEPPEVYTLLSRTRIMFLKNDL